MVLLGIWSPVSSPHPRHPPKPLSSGPCPLWGWRDTNRTGLGSVACEEPPIISALWLAPLNSVPWLEPIKSWGWEMMGGRLLTGGIPGEAAVWGCSDRVQPPVSFLLLLPQRPASAVSSGQLEAVPGASPQGPAHPTGGSAPLRGVCRVGAASWDQLVALENLPHTYPHTHTPLLCCRLPLWERRQLEYSCASHRSAVRAVGTKTRTTSRSSLQVRQPDWQRGYLGDPSELESV